MMQHSDTTQQQDRYDFHLRLKSISDKIRMASDITFAEYGLTGPQAGCIFYIHQAGGSILQKDLEKKTDVSHPTIVGIMTRLQEKGYVAIETDQSDRRKRIITLTDRAVSVSDELARRSGELNDILVADMSADDRAELQRLLQMVDRNLSATLSHGGYNGTGHATRWSV